MATPEVFEKVEFDRMNKRPLAFDGTIIATVDSRDYEIVEDDPHHWTELTVYRTRGGKFVLRTVGRSTVDGEIDRNTAVIRDSLDESEVMEFFKQYWLSKKLYEELGMDPTARID